MEKYVDKTCMMLANLLAITLYAVSERDITRERYNSVWRVLNVSPCLWKCTTYMSLDMYNLLLCGCEVNIDGIILPGELNTLHTEPGKQKPVQ